MSSLTHDSNGQPGAAPWSFLAAARSREELDKDYSPSRFVASLEVIVSRWRERTRTIKALHAPTRLQELSYGKGSHAKIDLYLADASRAPLLVFIHGGFWQQLSRNESGFFADAWTGVGVHVAVLGYDLAPAATLAAIVTQVRQGIAWLTKAAAGPEARFSHLIVLGHSAGAHLAAMSAVAGTEPTASRISGIVLVSGVYELEPIRKSYVNERVGMSEQDAIALSPIRAYPRSRLPVVIAAAEHESVAFHEHGRALAWAWRAHAAIDGMMLVPRRNHFSILDDLSDADSGLFQATRSLLAPRGNDAL